LIDIALIVLEHSFLNFPLIFGAYCSISLMKVPDLSIESAYVFGAITGSLSLAMYSDYLPLPLLFLLTIVSSLLGGLLVGLTSSILTHKAKLPHLLSSILTAGIFQGASLYALTDTNMSIIEYPSLLAYLKNPESRHPDMPMLIIFFLIFMCGGRLFLKTQIGQTLAVHGNNAKFFSHYGISQGYIFIFGLLLSNAAAGFAGFCEATSGGFADVGMGSGKALLAIVSLILGKTFVRPSKPFSIFVPIVGITSYFTIQQLLLRTGIALRYFTTIQALIVLLALVTVYKRKNGRLDHLGV
jgi:putative ABC transport system permease protein